MSINDPLGLPKGSVRAIIALGIIFSSIVYFFSYKDFPKELVGLDGIVIGYYMTKRTTEDDK